MKHVLVVVELHYPFSNAASEKKKICVLNTHYFLCNFVVSELDLIMDIFTPVKSDISQYHTYCMHDKKEV